MPDPKYTDAELERYFRDREARRSPNGGSTAPTSGEASPEPPASTPPIREGRAGNGSAGDGSPVAPPPRPAAPPRPPAARPGGPPDQAEIKRRTFIVFKYIGIGIGVFAGLVLLWLLWLSRDLPSLEQIENPRNLLATVVYTADGQELARYFNEENRTWVRLDQISPAVVQALIATEDRAFYDHWGVHLRRTLSAPIHIARGRPQGGSTITQQLARNLYREQVGFERSVTRKIKEILTAIRIERTFSKDEILEAYLNTVPWGYNAYGIEMAAQTYFSKPAAELTASEGATLIGMLAATSRYNPIRHPEAAQARRNLVLANMAHEGYLDPGQLAELQAQPIEIRFRRYSHEENLAPHFAEYLRLWFREWCRANGYDPYSDGLVIRTTIDSRVQALAQQAVDRQMRGLQAVVDFEWAGGGGLGSDPEAYYRRMQRGDVEPFSLWWARNDAIVNEYIAESERFEELRAEGLSRGEAIARLRRDDDFIDSLKTTRTRLEVGLVAMNPRSGRVLAWVGGANFIADKFDHVAQARRQPGSTFKPFAYTAAFDLGYSPNAPLLDGPLTWGDWRPRNSGGGYSGFISLRTALAHSKNVVAARLTREITPEQVRIYAAKLGIRSCIEPVRSIALGTNDVNLLEMAAAYSTLASGGIFHGPPLDYDPARANDPADPCRVPLTRRDHQLNEYVTLAVARIEDRYGNVIAEFNPGGREVLNPNSAYTIVDVLRGTIQFGTARSLRGRFDLNDLDLAGKTGTTQESADGWFMVMHPDLVVGAWNGFNDRRITFRSSYWGQGAHSAMLVAGDFLERMANASDPRIRLSPDHRFEKPPDYRAPTRGFARRPGEGGFFRRPRARSGDPNRAEDDRPARDLLDRWRQREREENSEGGGRGRIGW
ncbi:MAG TPA: transglycosylase domain-containing protein [Rubricoccaceae bacterium]|nr:transglycosylase domain-containing protein [Rubricoccaceae bacterium]